MNTHRFSRFAGSVTAVVLCLTVSAFAQRGGGGSDFGGGHGAGGGGDSGSEKAVIGRYSPPKEGQDNTHGTVSVQTESGKRLNLEIREKDNIKLQIGSHEITPEDYEKYLLPGLAVNVTWNTNKVGKKVSYLQSLTFETIAIEGKIMSVDDDGGKIRVLSAPANNQKWPALKKPPAPKPPKPKPPSSSGTGTTTTKPPKPPVPPREKPVQRKNLQLRFFEGISSITDNAKQTLTPADLRGYKDQQFNGTIIFGKTVCVLVDGQIEGEKQEKTSDAGSGEAKGG
jgi:hypothetical protein